MESEEKCKKCGGTGIVKEKNGVSHTCFDCLLNGRMDQHSENLKDPKNLGISV
jgi:hypothetical protein